MFLEFEVEVMTNRYGLNKKIFYTIINTSHTYDEDTALEIFENIRKTILHFLISFG